MRIAKFINALNVSIMLLLGFIVLGGFVPFVTSSAHAAIATESTDQSATVKANQNRLIYLGREFDKCSGRLTVYGPSGQVSISRGHWTWAYVGSRRFMWYCGGSREWTTAPRSTNWVKVYHVPGSRDIIWDAYYYGP